MAIDGRIVNREDMAIDGRIVNVIENIMSDRRIVNVQVAENYLHNVCVPYPSF